MTTYEKVIATWNEFIQEFPDAIDLAEFDLLKEVAYIKKVGSEWCVFGESGRKMGCYSSRKQAEDRLAQVEMFKHMKSDVDTASARECVCENCGTNFSSYKNCDESRCPTCGEYEAHEPDDEQEKSSRNECVCDACGNEFFTSRNCQDAICPVCGERDAEDI